MKKIYLGIFIAWMATACQTDTAVPVEDTLKVDYAVGDELVYEVKEEVYSVSEEPQFTTFQQKEVVVAKQTEGINTDFVIERYRRNDATMQWQIVQLVKLRRTPAELIELGENPVIKLVFPVNEAEDFNSNRYNNASPTKATYRNVNAAYGDFPTTFTVVMADDSTLINLNKSYEIYRPLKGVVYKEIANLNYCQATPDCIGKGIIESGVRRRWRLLPNEQ